MAKQPETIENKKTSRNTKFREVLKHSENVVVIAPGFEPGTVCLEGRCSIQLSYATKRMAKIEKSWIFLTSFSTEIKNLVI